MTYKTCYWDDKTQSQQERDATPEEQIEIDARIAARGELEAAMVRQERDEKLKSSDWTQLADSPVYKTAWAIYRQELRDISTQDGFPTAVVWPVKP